MKIDILKENKYKHTVGITITSLELLSMQFDIGISVHWRGKSHVFFLKKKQYDENLQECIAQKLSDITAVQTINIWIPCAWRPNECDWWSDVFKTTVMKIHRKWFFGRTVKERKRNRKAQTIIHGISVVQRIEAIRYGSNTIAYTFTKIRSCGVHGSNRTLTPNIIKIKKSEFQVHKIWYAKSSTEYERIATKRCHAPYKYRPYG